MVVQWSFGTVSISNGFQDTQFNAESDAMADITLNDLQTNVKVIHFGTNREVQMKALLVYLI